MTGTAQATSPCVSKLWTEIDLYLCTIEYIFVHFCSAAIIQAHSGWPHWPFRTTVFFLMCDTVLWYLPFVISSSCIFIGETFCIIDSPARPRPHHLHVIHICFIYKMAYGQAPKLWYFSQNHGLCKGTSGFGLFPQLYRKYLQVFIKFQLYKLKFL